MAVRIRHTQGCRAVCREGFQPYLPMLCRGCPISRGTSTVVPPEAACGGLLCVEDAIAAHRASRGLAWRHGEALRVAGKTLVGGDHDFMQKCPAWRLAMCRGSGWGWLPNIHIDGWDDVWWRCVSDTLRAVVPYAVKDSNHICQSFVGDVQCGWVWV